MTNPKKNFKNVYEQARLEKTKKYGDPDRNLLITLGIIALVAVILIVTKQKSENGTLGFTRYYPSSTLLYMDFDEDNIKIKNESIKSGIKSFAFSNLFKETLNKNIYNILLKEDKKKLVRQGFKGNYSFGIWSRDKKLAKPAKLGIINLNNEVFATNFINQIFHENNTFSSKVFKGYKIIILPKGAYFINKRKLYLADSKQTLEYLIDNFILKKSDSLKSSKIIKNFKTLFNDKRAATIIAKDLNKFLGHKGLSEIHNYSIGILKLENDICDLNIFSKVKTALPQVDAKEAITSTFKKNKIYRVSKFIPDDTLLYISINNIYKYKNLLTPLLENESPFNFFDIIAVSKQNDLNIEELLKSNIFGALFNQKDYIFMVSKNEKIDKFQYNLENNILNKFMDIKSINYGKNEFKAVYNKKAQEGICWGEFNKEFYAISNTNSIQKLVNLNSNKKSKKLANNEYFLKLLKKNPQNSDIFAFVKINKLDAIEHNQKFLDLRNNENKNLFVSELLSKLDRLMLNINYNRDMINYRFLLDFKE